MCAETSAKLVPARQEFASRADPACTSRLSKLFDERLISTLRVFAACASILVYRLDPSENELRRPLALAVLAAFGTYSAVQAILARVQAWRVPMSVAPWVDLGWVTLLIAASQGTSSIFFPLYIFGILCASFTSGFRSGATLVGASVVSFGVAGGLTSAGRSFELDQALIRPLYLLILGYLIAYWGEHQIRLRARLALLRDVTALTNPRFGTERMLQRLVDALHRFHGAVATHLVVRDNASGAVWLRSAPRADEAATAPAMAVPPGLTALSADDLPGAALVFHGSRRRRSGAFEVVDRKGAARGRAPADRGAELAGLIGAASFLSAPLRLGPLQSGRVYIGAARRDAFDDSDGAFLAHVLDQVSPVLENVRLVDELATRAAEEERRRVGRDLHDSVVQSYVGLLLGLGGAQAALDAGDVSGARRHLDHLREIGEDEVRGIRTFVHHLRASAEDARDAAPLRTALVRYCARFTEATGVRVDVDTGELGGIGDRVAVEVFHLVSEALSNARRHAAATRASVNVGVRDGALVVRVENDGASPSSEAFSPRSLSDRAAALGGALEVVPLAAGTVAVQIHIPL
jgi:signal transduction histidine kinase